jgi:hypothetical protein
MVILKEILTLKSVLLISYEYISHNTITYVDQALNNCHKVYTITCLDTDVTVCPILLDIDGHVSAVNSNFITAS